MWRRLTNHEDFPGLCDRDDEEHTVICPTCGASGYLVTLDNGRVVAGKQEAIVI